MISTPTAESVSMEEIVGLFRRNLRLFLLVFLLFCVSAVAIALYLPKQYKSRAVLNIQSRYFQNPLVSDLVAEVHNQRELQAQRQSLLRLALSDDFIDSLARDFQQYSFSADTPAAKITRERELFRQRIEFFSLSPTTFQISVIDKNPEYSFAMTSRVLERMTRTLVEERRRSLVKARDAVQDYVQSLGLALGGLTEGAGAGNPTVLRSELQQLEANITSLKTRFTSKHPKVAALEQRAAAVRRLLGRMGEDASGEKAQKPPVFLEHQAKGSSKEVYQDLLRKLSYLNISLEIEGDDASPTYLSVIEEPTIPGSPIFPSKRLFLLAGAFLGLVAGVMAVVLREIRSGAFLAPEQAARILESEFLGELPPLEENGHPEIKLLEGGNFRKQIPFQPHRAG